MHEDILMKVIIVLLCLFVGTARLGLLNGQTFTNALYALPFFLAAAVISAATFLDRRTSGYRRWAWGLATFLTAFLVAVTLLSLPSAYRSQEGFNEAPRRAIERHWRQQWRKLLDCPTHDPMRPFGLPGISWLTPLSSEW
jgi:hypothetical protein